MAHSLWLLKEQKYLNQRESIYTKWSLLDGSLTGESFFL